LLEESAALVKELKKLPPSRLGALMGISPKLAELNAARYREFTLPFTPDNAKPALLAFRGDVYSGIEADDYGKEDFAFAEAHLRILSGLYGLLSPLDLMQPYRLEMGTSLRNPRGRDLYAFWGGRITQAVNDALKTSGSSHLVNLASQEYFAAVKPDSLEGNIITPVFKENKSGLLKVIGLLAKKARGMMANYAIKQRITNPESLKFFSQDGYRFAPELSDRQEWVFVRG
jgi:hypothetical protein